MTLLRRAGNALYGTTEWSLIRFDLGLNERTLRRMAKDDALLPDGVRRDVETLLRDRGTAIDNLLLELAA